MRELLRKFPAEFVFVIIYLTFLACYNYAEIAKFLPRFAIPVLPFLLFSARNWIPNNRLLLWPLAVFSSLIAIAARIGLPAMFGFSLHG
jgi:hypothetical protein